MCPWPQKPDNLDSIGSLADNPRPQQNKQNILGALDLLQKAREASQPSLRPIGSWANEWTSSGV